MINNKFRQALIENSSIFERPEEDANIEPLRFVVISTEGTETEPSYFNNLNYLLSENHINLRFLVLEHVSGENTPERLVELLRECKSVQCEDLISPTFLEILKNDFSDNTIKFNLDKEKILDKKNIKKHLLAYGIDIDFHKFLKKYDRQCDTFVVILDRDAKNHSLESLQTAHDICTKERFDFCMTNPCFEFWLFLHLFDKNKLPKFLYNKILENEKVSSKHTFMSKKLSQLAHHNKKLSRKKFLQYYAKTIPVAIKNAELFATDFQGIQNELGTNLGVFLSAIESKYAFLFTQL